MKIQFILSLWLTVEFVIFGAADRFGCNKRFFKSNSFVCVCNSTYCDTIEQVDTDQTSKYFQEFVTSKTQHRLQKFKHEFQVKYIQINVIISSNVFVI